MTTRTPGSTDDGGARDYTSFEGDKTREGMGFAGVAEATRVDAPRPVTPASTIDPGAPVASAAPVEAAARERSEPIRVFSMKEHTARRQTEEHRAPLHIQLRSLAEVAGRRHDTPPAGLGHLAPPRDPAQAKTRHWRANAVWGLVVVALAAAIALAIWLVAGHGR